MIVIWNLNRFDFLRSSASLFFDVYNGGIVSYCYKQCNLFFVSRSVWIVIENNYPALCSDNAHFFHQLTRVRHSASYHFTAAPNQPQQLHKFLFTVVWTFRLIQINIHAHLTRQWDALRRMQEQCLRKFRSSSHRKLLKWPNTTPKVHSPSVR